MATFSGSSQNDTLTGSAAADLLTGYDPASPGAVSIAAEQIAAGFDSPVYVTAPPGDAGRLFVVERDGVIRVLDLASGSTQVFLDISGQVSTDGEQGLLGLAFDPDYAANGRFYVNYTNLAGDTEIRSFQVSADDADRAEATGLAMLTVDQPFANHNGGWLGFGPDGYLYVALGDGGGAGDPFGNGQNTDTLLGSILRIDPWSDAFLSDPGRNYGIPADNPFVGTAGADEIWAYGLRNPWRASFDAATGTFWIADVGQDAWEEVNLGVAGGNYGWNVYEGSVPYEAGALTGGSAIPPVAVYGHDLGQSITGGYVYRGDSPVLQGAYLYGDFISGRVWSLEVVNGTWVSTERTVVTSGASLDNPVSFGEDADANLYAVDFDGEIFALTPHLTDGADQINAAAGPDTVFGGWQGDVLVGGDGADIVCGNRDGDVVLGNQGNDWVFGGADDDFVFGGRGADTVSGDSGNDTLWGDDGADLFILAAAGGSDIIMDFSAADGDRLLVPDGAAVSLSRDAAGNAVIGLDQEATVTLAGIPAVQGLGNWLLSGSI